MSSTAQTAYAGARLRKAARLHTLGAALFWVGLVGSSIPFAARSLLPPWVLFPLIVTLIAAMFVGVGIGRHGRKLMAAARGERILLDDPRPPVVYLRSFAADTQGAGIVNSWLLLRPGYFTEEEQLAMVMNEIGPFVAIGDPRESLPDLGASRLYVGDDDWHRKVTDLLSRAALVMLRAGMTEGFWWEFGVVRSSTRPERVLLLIPTDKAEYEQFRKRAAELLPYPLPEFPRGTRLLGKTAAVMAFEANWRAWTLPVVRSFSRSALTAPYLSRVKLTLKPIFERLGVPWSEPPVARKRMIVIATLGAIAALFGALWLAIVLPDWLPSGQRESALPAGGVELVPTKDAYDLALENFASRAAALPELRQLLPTLNPSAAGAVGTALSRKGLPRLSDDLLMQRVSLMRRILNEADVQTCAAIFRGDLAVELEPALRRLSPDELRQWFSVSFEALVAEVRRTNARELTPAQVRRALRELLAQVNARDSGQLRSMLDNPRAGTDEDACHASRLLYAALSQLPEQPRAVLSRAFVVPWRDRLGE